MSKNLINIPPGETRLIDGQLYLSEESTFGCVACDLSNPIIGCTNVKVICCCPQRVFKKVNDYCYDYDDYDDFEYMKWYEALLLIVILIIPMTYIMITDKIKKLWQERKK